MTEDPTPAESTAEPASEWVLERLALFPEQNPNLVIETDLAGRVTYMNPAAAHALPGLRVGNSDHPLLDGLSEIVAGFLAGDHEPVAREVDTGPAVFEQKICWSPAGSQDFVRIYSHDITDLRRAEQAVQELARQVVIAQEEERHRVSRELHDEAGQALAALKISLQLLREEADPEAARRTIGELVELVDVTRERIRLLAHDLRPPALDAVGLDAALEDFCAEFAKRTTLEIDYSGASVGRLSEAVEICLYRFLQEALANTAIHASATRAEVRLRTSDENVLLRVSDDGKGMDPPRLEGRSGFGLVGMRERVELLGGRMSIDAKPGRGTTVVAYLPRVRP